MHRPVRQYSLGQKMRANLAAAFLHNPKVVYLDEPTIGLDVLAKETIRKFINNINKERNTTIILTTHDMDDIEEICERTILINNGGIFYDGKLNTLKTKYSSGIEVMFEINNPEIDKRDISIIKKKENNKYYILLKNKNELQKTVHTFLSRYSVSDISIKEISLEDIIKNIHSKKQ